MKTGARVGLAVAAGYFLGRFHKLKWALGLAAVGAGKRLTDSNSDLMRQGAKKLLSSPEVSNLTGELRGRLVEAGKTAATAATSRWIGSVTDSLRQRTDLLRASGGSGGAGQGAAGTGKHAAGSQDGDEKPARGERATGNGGRAGRGDRPAPSGEPSAGRRASQRAGGASGSRQAATRTRAGSGSRPRPADRSQASRGAQRPSANREAAGSRRPAARRKREERG